MAIASLVPEQRGAQTNGSGGRTAAGDGVTSAASQRRHGKYPKWLALAALVLVVIGGAYYARAKLAARNGFDNVASGNGRIEAIEIDVSAKYAARVKDILVEEGDFVKAGQVLAHMDTSQLEAQRRQGEAQLRRAVVGVSMAKSLVAQRQAERRQALALIAQRDALLRAASRRYERTEQLVKSSSLPLQTLDDDGANLDSQKAAKAGAQAQLAAAEAGIAAAKIQIMDGEAAIDAARASIDNIVAQLDDSELTSPRDGRVQLRVAQPGEVLSPGGRVLNLVDLSDVYMTFFLPTEQAGRVAFGADVRLVLDALPNRVIPAKVTFVAAVAQFTPKTVETQKEREKLMFRVKARIPAELLRKYITYVKVGLPGVAYVRLDPKQDWPAALANPVHE